MEACSPKFSAAPPRKRTVQHVATERPNAEHTPGHGGDSVDELEREDARRPTSNRLGRSNPLPPGKYNPPTRGLHRRSKKAPTKGLGGEGLGDERSILGFWVCWCGILCGCRPDQRLDREGQQTGALT